MAGSVYVNIGLFVFAVLVVVFLFFMSSKREYTWLKLMIAIVLVLGTYLHWRIIDQIPGSMDDPDAVAPSPFAAFVISFISSVELFLGSTRIFDNGFQDFLFTKTGTPYLTGLSLVYLTAVCISLFVIFNFVFHRLFSKWRLRLKSFPPADKDVHIFFGDTKYTGLLVKEISKDSIILIIDYPNENDTDYDVSFTGGLERLSHKKKRHDAAVYLKAKNKLSDVELSSKTIGEILDLKGIDEWIFRSRTFLYFLSDNEKENILSLDNIRLRKRQICAGSDNSRKVCHVYVHAKKEGLNISREDDYRGDFDVRFVDSSYLAIRQIICEDQASLPVHFVKIHTEQPVEGRPECYSLGYVESAFNAAIFGFGELGHDAFDFLYEYGAFVNKEGTRSDFHVYAYDKQAESIETFKTKEYPGIGHPEDIIDLITADLSKDSFWNSFKLPAPLNYVFICTGNDELNLNILERLDGYLKTAADQAALRIMVKHSAGSKALKPNSIKNVVSCVRFFGADEDIWRYRIISDASFMADAKKYFVAYTLASNGADSEKSASDKWDLREEEIAAPISPNRKKRIRQRSQDFANSLHIGTKKALIGAEFLKIAPQLSASIPSVYSQPECCEVAEEPHCINPPAPVENAKKMLEYLAKGEHIRWVASHIVLGYAYGNETDDELKTHSCITSYEEIPDYPDSKTGVIDNYGLVRHYDWIVIKTTLEMASSDNRKNTTTKK